MAQTQRDAGLQSHVPYVLSYYNNYVSIMKQINTIITITPIK